MLQATSVLETDRVYVNPDKCKVMGCAAYGMGQQTFIYSALQWKYSMIKAPWTVTYQINN